MKYQILIDETLTPLLLIGDTHGNKKGIPFENPEAVKEIVNDELFYKWADESLIKAGDVDYKGEMRPYWFLKAGDILPFPNGRTLSFKNGLAVISPLDKYKARRTGNVVEQRDESGQWRVIRVFSAGGFGALVNYDLSTAPETSDEYFARKKKEKKEKEKRSRLVTAFLNKAPRLHWCFPSKLGCACNGCINGYNELKITVEEYISYLERKIKRLI